MNTVFLQKSNVSQVSDIPAQLMDSGYGSEPRKLDELRNGNARDLCFTSVASSRFTSIGRKSMLSNVETIKKKLFSSSPHTLEERSPNSDVMSTLTPIGKMQQRLISNIIEDLEDMDVLEKKTDLKSLKYPASPMKFYYSPLKNSLLFANEKPSPMKSAVPIIKSPIKTSESWCASLNLPEQRKDFLQNLANKNLGYGMSIILSTLSDEEVFKVSCVSRAWRKIVLNDSDACKRRRSFMVKRTLYKENKQSDPSKPLRNGPEGDREVLLNITNKEFPKQSPAALLTKSECFQEVVKTLGKNEVILKCPMCQYPAKCMTGNKYSCIRASCSYTFCRKCSGSSHAYSQDCSDYQISPKLIGSKRSKQNLRRL